jgi:polyisoprenoid-binding protein YceI
MFESSETTTWTIDPAHTEAEFAVRHLMISTVKGQFSDVSGTLVLDDSQPSRSSVEVEIGVSSVDTREAKRDEHLRSADFFSAKEYPSMKFRSTEVERTGEDTYRVKGDLTIRGVTKPVELSVEREGQAKDPWGGERIGFSATTRVDRRDFGLMWNVPLEAGGFLVANEVKVTLSVQAVLAAEVTV